MDISKLKNLVRHDGGKVILVENGEAELVVMSFKEYERLSRGGNVAGPGLASEAGERVRNYADDFSFDSPDETELVVPTKSDPGKFLVRLEDIRLEDLPV